MLLKLWREFLRNGQFDRQALRVPRRFNWVRDIFEELHLADRPQQLCLRLQADSGLTELSYLELGRQADALLNGFRARGLRAGDVVYVMSGLQPGLWAAYLALIKGGMRIVPTANVLTSADLAYRIGLHRPQLAVVDQDNAGKLPADLPRLVLDDEASWADFSADRSPTQAADTAADDPLFLFFTSGTTGFPKVVVHTHTSYPIGHLSTASWIGLRPDDLHYNIAQPGWAKFAWSSFFAALNAGCSLFSLRSRGNFQAAQQLQAIQAHRVTTLCAPPTALRMLIGEDLSAYRFSLRECVSAGEPLNPEVIQAWRRGTGLTLRDGYGQTETTCMIYNPPGLPVRPGSMGRPSEWYDMLIADEQGRELPPHQDGQIAVRLGSPFRGVFQGYLGADEQQAQVFRHGLYYTGDKAYVDEDGYYWFVARDDDVIKTSDYRVGPFEVESVLLEVPEVVESAVVARPHPIRGAEVKAYLVVQGEPSEALARRIFQHCQQRLAGYKRPRRLQFVAELPKTSSGKIRRVELRQAEHERDPQAPLAPGEYRSDTKNSI